MRILLLLLFTFTTFISHADDEGREQYKIFITSDITTQKSVIKDYYRKFLIEAIISTKMFTPSFGHHKQDIKKKYFVVNLQLKPSVNKKLTDIQITLFRYPKKSIVNRVTKLKVTENKLNIELRDSIYKLFYGKLFIEGKQNNVIDINRSIKQLETPPSTLEKSSLPPEEKLGRNGQKYLDSTKKEGKKKKINKKNNRKKRKNSDKINDNYNSSDITEKKKITPPEVLSQSWISKYGISVAHSIISIQSSTSLLQILAKLRSVYAKIDINKKQLERRNSHSISFSVEKPVYKSEYKIPLLYQLNYLYDIRVFKEYLMIHPFVGIEKNYFINLIYFGERINVLPMNIFWAGAALTFNFKAKLRASYATVAMGDAKYNEVAAPITGSRIMGEITIPVYKMVTTVINTVINYERYTITTSLGNTSNQFSRITLGVNFSF